MLAVFDATVAKCPKELIEEDGGGDIVGGAAAIVKHYAATKEEVVIVGLGSCGSLAYSAKYNNPFIPRLFASIDDIFCSFQGLLENLAILTQQYGLSKRDNEATVAIEAYRTLRDRGPYPATQVVRHFRGKFSFILFDSSTKSAFIAANSEGGIPFYWGADPEGNMVLSDDVEIVRKSCGRSFAPFPKGCFFTTSKGLQSYEHPLNEVRAVPRVDSQGEVCGADFIVDETSKKDIAGIPRASSGEDWSSRY